MANKTKIKPQGRPRKFDESEVVQRAAIIFLESGFEAASYEKIASSLGMSKPSLYNAFGDKHALFERVLGDYAKQAHTFILLSFDGAASLSDASERLLCAAAEFYSRPDDYSLGCLLIGTALPASSQHASIRALLEGFISAVEQSLENIISEKFISDAENLGKTPREIAIHVASLIFALAVRARTGLTRQKLITHARELSAMLR